MAFLGWVIDIGGKQGDMACYFIELYHRDDTQGQEGQNE